MTHAEIRAAIAANSALAGVTDTQVLADALSMGRKRIESRIVSARGLASGMPGGPLAAETVLMKLEGARDSFLASADQSQKVLGSLLRRQLSFLAGDGLDFGAPALRGMIDQFATLQIITTAEATALKALAEVPDPISEFEVRRAIYADNGDLLI